MTTTTPESRGRIAYTAYGRGVDFRNCRDEELATFDELPEKVRQAWIKSANTIWELATTGRTTI